MCNLVNHYMQNTPRAAPRSRNRSLPAIPGASARITLMLTYSKQLLAFLSGFITQVINITFTFLYRSSSIRESWVQQSYLQL